MKRELGGKERGRGTRATRTRGIGGSERVGGVTGKGLSGTKWGAGDTKSQRKRRG